MFRRISNEQDNKLELRHQRTGDVVFNWIGILARFITLDPIDPYVKPDYYTYKLIETLLPKAKIDPKKK